MVAALGLVLQRLESIIFVRPADYDDRYDSAIHYTVHVTPEHTIHLGPNAAPVTRPALVKLSLPPTVCTAALGQSDACPRPEPPYKWRAAAIHFVEEHPTVGMAAAVAGGIILSEGSRVLYARTIGA